MISSEDFGGLLGFGKSMDFFPGLKALGIGRSLGLQGSGLQVLGFRALGPRA